VIPKLETGLTHATAVAINGSGLLITGPSGSGKSGLALQLITLGACLISDDQVLLFQDGTEISLQTAPNLAGKIEARFFGILDVPQRANAPLSLVVSLDKKSTDRLPDPHIIHIGTSKIDLIHGANVPNLAFALTLKFRGSP